VVAGTLEDVAAPPGGFDAVTLFHVIEHVASPRTLLEQVRGVVKSGGTVLIETPTVDCAWFRLAPRTWRQLIPDHYFFFSEATLGRLLCDCDLVPVACRKVGRRVSLRFLGDRVRRSVAPSRSSPTPILDKLGLADRSLYVNPGDIMSVVARAE
jgi:SAM-dependent methyltransferase